MSGGRDALEQDPEYRKLSSAELRLLAKVSEEQLETIGGGGTAGTVSGVLILVPSDTRDKARKLLADMERRGREPTRQDARKMRDILTTVFVETEATIRATNEKGSQ